ncbi:MAG TPA: ASPIC/UnbV domain-containing protein, partial [Vicinamibacteria bacterium]|nr:ASPIC/UnbV domain-containing protein [Vicinamibacteria bacterium]
GAAGDAEAGGGWRFTDVAQSVGVAGPRAIDNDGDQDVFEQMGGAYLADKARSTLFENPGNENAWLGLELEGVRSNRRAVGARIKVTVDGGEGPRSIHRTVGSGGSFGASPLRQEIGLGRATSVRRVEVSWPATGEVQTIDGLEPRRRYRIREGSPQATEVRWPRAGRGGASTP